MSDYLLENLLKQAEHKLQIADDLIEAMRGALEALHVMSETRGAVAAETLATLLVISKDFPETPAGRLASKCVAASYSVLSFTNWSDVQRLNKLEALAPVDERAQGTQDVVGTLPLRVLIAGGVKQYQVGNGPKAPTLREAIDRAEAGDKRTEDIS